MRLYLSPLLVVEPEIEVPHAESIQYEGITVRELGTDPSTTDAFLDDSGSMGHHDSGLDDCGASVEDALTLWALC